MLAVIGIILGMAFLCYSIYKGINPAVSAIIAAFIIMLTSGMAIQESWTEAIGTVGTVMGILAPIWILGGIMGVLYAESGAAASIGDILMVPVRKISNPKLQRFAACMVIILMSMIIGASGVDGNAILVTIMAVTIAVFKEYNLPVKYIPALAYIAATCTNILPGTPQVVFVLMEEYLEGFSNSANLGIRYLLLLIYLLVAVVTVFVFMERDVAKGVGFKEGTLVIDSASERKKPHWILTLIPIIAIFVGYNYCGLEAWSSLLVGLLLSIVLFVRYLPFENNGETKFQQFLHYVDKGTFMLPLAVLMILLPTTLLTMSSGLDTITNGLMGTFLPAGVVLVIIASVLMGFGGTGVTASVASICVASFMPTGLTATGCALIIAWSFMTLGHLPTDNGIILRSQMCGTTVEEAYPIMFITTVVYTYAMAFICAMLATAGII